jgi:hypothetical protein
MEDDLGPPPNTNPPLVRNDAAPPPERVTINGNIYPVIYLQLNGNYARYAVIDGINRLIISDDNGQRVQMDDQTFVQVTPVNLAAALNNMPQVPANGGRRRSKSRRSRRTKRSRRSRRV